MFFLLPFLIDSALNSSEIPLNQITQIRYRHWTDWRAEIGDSRTETDTYENVANKVHNHESDTLAYTGSFCPPRDGSYVFKANGRGILDFKFLDSQLPSCYKSDDSPCGSRRECNTKSVYLKKGMCYPLIIKEFSSCIWREAHLSIQISIDGSNFYYPDDYIREENVPRCLKWYYGKSCTRCTVDCNGYGYCGGDRADADTADICHCTANTEDTFCEPKNKVHITSKSPGINIEYYEGENTNTVSDYAVKTDLNYLEFNEHFNKIVVKGNIYLPQNSKYKIRVTSIPNVILNINNKNYGSIYNYECKETTENEIVSDEFSGDHILMPFTITMNSGCAFHKQYIKVEWMFYRWYTDKGKNPEWTEIPSKYLFQY